MDIDIKDNHFNDDVFNEKSTVKQLDSSELINELLRTRIITEDQLGVAQKEQIKTGTNENISTILVRMGFVSQSTIGEILNRSSDIKNFDIKSIIIERDLVKRIPKSFAMQNLVIPVFKKDDVITIAIADIFNIITLDQVKRFFP